MKLVISTCISNVLNYHRLHFYMMLFSLPFGLNDVEPPRERLPNKWHPGVLLLLRNLLPTLVDQIFQLLLHILVVPLRLN